MRIAAINVDVMTTVTVTTVGASRRCPRTEEQRRGSGVAPADPDKWPTMRTVSAGGGYDPILLGKLEAGGAGSIASTQRPTAKPKYYLCSRCKGCFIFMIYECLGIVVCVFPSRIVGDCIAYVVVVGY